MQLHSNNNACTRSPATNAGATLAPHASAGVVVERFAVRVFEQFAWLEADSVKLALSRPTPPDRACRDHQYP